jgi:hypothetical protein
MAAVDIWTAAFKRNTAKIHEWFSTGTVTRRDPDEENDDA